MPFWPKAHTWAENDCLSYASMAQGLTGQQFISRWLAGPWSFLILNWLNADRIACMSARYSILTYDTDDLDYAECADTAEILQRVQPERVNWITMSGISLQDDHLAIKTLLDHFQLSPLLFNSIYDYEQQQFEGEYDDCFYLDYSTLLYRPSKHSTASHARVTGSIILGPYFLILIEKTPSGLFEKTRKKVLGKHTKAQRNKVDYLLYLLIKTIVVNYQGIFKSLTEKFEDLEDEVINHPGRDYVYDQILELREEFKPLYSYLIDLDDFVNTLREEESRFIGKETKKYFTKTLDREMDDLLASYQNLRTWITEMIEIHRANVNESTNRVMKTLTVLSTIFLPLTFIVGIYGMNFEHMPELTWDWAYPAVMIFMALLALGAILYMRIKKWI
jgi:magnesium transporter